MSVSSGTEDEFEKYADYAETVHVPNKFNELAHCWCEICNHRAVVACLENGCKCCLKAGTQAKTPP